MAKYTKILLLFLIIGMQTCLGQNDCVNAIVSCGSTSFNNLAVAGAGIQEVTGVNSCGSGEYNSLWIKVTIKTPGTLGFIITPESTNLNVDFDFYVFGPGPEYNCQNLGNAISCSTTNPIASGATSNLTGMIETETDYMEGPSELGNNFVRWMDVLTDETYYIVIDRALGNGNFSLQWTGTATFSDPPVINETTSGVLNLSRCDSDAIPDESTEFDLTQSGAIAIGSQLNLIATYYLSQNDATVGTNAISNPTGYPNATNPQTVFIRLQNALTGCFTTSSFTLSVTPFNLPDIPDLQECDDNNDGLAVFHLSAIRNLLNGNPNNIISFHHSDSDPVNLPDNYTNQVPFTNETLWVKVESTLTGCTAYKPFSLILNSTPPVISTQLTQCDFELFPDGLTTFYLTEANNALTNGDPTLTTKFYLNSTDAANNQNEVNSIFNNTSNPQTLVVKVLNSDTGCYSFSQLTLNVTTNPTTTVTLRNCDDLTEDGIATFVLADAGFESGGNNVSYYNNSHDALAEQNPITTNQFGNQDVYVRVENGNNCTGIHIIHLEVAALPQVSIDSNGILCTNSVNHSATLTASVSHFGSYHYDWLPGGATTSQLTVVQPGDYTVTVTDTSSSCSNSATIHVDASEAPIVNSTEVADLVQINSVTVNTTGNGDYWYSLDDGLLQPTPFFDHVPPGQHWITIEDRNGCGMVTQTVFVLGIPPYFTPNGDGYQDSWQIKGLDGRTNRETKIQIFNRYGKLLQQISPYTEAWDGTYNGHPLPADDYWYSIQFEDGRSAKGHFTLKR